MMTINTNAKLFTPKDAEVTAALLQEGETDWTYVVKHDPKGIGYSFIEVRDNEDDHLIAHV